MLQVGQRAPEFTLPGTDGGTVDSHSLTEYTGRGRGVVLAFYPFDFHPACVTQWCSLRDADWLTLLEDVVVLGVSTDSVYSHEAFANEHGLGFTLLSDGDGTVSEAYGVLEAELEGHRSVAGRAVYVLEPGRRVQYAWRGGDATDQPDFDAIRKATGCFGEECAVPEN